MNATTTTPTTLTAWPTLEDECKRLGFHGVCPEALTCIRENNADGWASKQLRFEYHDLMRGMRALFAPRQS